MVFTGALLLGVLAWRLRQPVILGYVLAGLILSPFTPGLRIHDLKTFEVMAEIGVILLMFSIGMEFSIPALLRLKWIALVGAPLGLCLSIGLGVVAGKLLGWPLNQSIAIGCIISVASTMVLMSLLISRGELSSESGRIMVTLSLVEDLAVVFLTVMLTSLGSGGGASFLAIGWKVLKSILLLVPVVLLGWKFIPSLLRKVEKTSNDEISLLFALTICIVVAAISEAVGLSLALGAFVGGMLLGSSPYAHKLAHQTLPLRDIFVALFFVTIGMLIDPHSWLAEWRLILTMVALILVGKFVIWFGVVRLFRYRTQTAWRVGIGLTQIGEFSFILAQVSRHAGIITTGVYNATLAAALITILINASLFKLVPHAPEPAEAQAKPASTKATAAPSHA
jgi:CPA2 family monovalent cation:H+ antiporter-2